MWNGAKISRIAAGLVLGVIALGGSALAGPASEPSSAPLTLAALSPERPSSATGTPQELDLGKLDIATPEGAQRLQIGYEVFIGGLRLASIDLVTVVDHGHYVAASVIATKGLADAFASSNIQVVSTGDVHGHLVVPRTYNSDTQSENKRQLVGLLYAKDGAPSAINASPPYDLQRYPVSEPLQRDTVDPVSAALFIALGSSVTDDQKCGQIIPIFDGKRRYNLNFSFVDNDRISVPRSGSKKSERLPALLCRAKYERVAGFKPPKPGHKGIGLPPFEIWLAPFAGTDLLVPVRMQASTEFGGIVARAVRLDVEPGADRT